MPQFEIEYFEDENGSRPAEEFILSLPIKMRAKTFQLLVLLEERGNVLREPYSKLLEDGIFELRIKQGNNIARILYFFVLHGKIILTNGFIKKSQKTPKREIEKAKENRKEYLRRTHNEKWGDLCGKEL